MLALAVDIGTTSMKVGVFREGEDAEPVQLKGFSESYPLNVRNGGTFCDIDQRRWLEAFHHACRQLADFLPEVDVVSLSGTTPGLSAMDRDGTATYPAIVMLDQRSRKQAVEIIQKVGMEKLLAETANAPVPGGCSLASILWIRENEPDAFRRTACFGHSNTFFAAWLTGTFAIDPSSASLSGLYNTVKNDLTWNSEIARAFDLDLGRLPEVIPSHGSVGRVKPDLAAELGLARRPIVVIGGNDAVLAAYDAGIREPGQAINVNGTSEITLVCLPRCLPSTHYNIRAHVLPGLWLTLYVMNAGGMAYQWFRRVLCSEMTEDAFWSEFAPRALQAWLSRSSDVRYVPFLMGCRYTLEPLRAEFKGLSDETGREEMFAAMVRGLCEYQREHLDEVSRAVPLADEVVITGGALSDTLVQAKRRWMRDCSYRWREQSSLRGAARLGLKAAQGA